MMFQVRKLMRFVVWPMAGAASRTGVAAVVLSSVRRDSMTFSSSVPRPGLSLTCSLCRFRFLVPADFPPGPRRVFGKQATAYRIPRRLRLDQGATGAEALHRPLGLRDQFVHLAGIGKRNCLGLLARL